MRRKSRLFSRWLANDGVDTRTLQARPRGTVTNTISQTKSVQLLVSRWAFGMAKHWSNVLIHVCNQIIGRLLKQQARKNFTTSVPRQSALKSNERAGFRQPEAKKRPR